MQRVSESVFLQSRSKKVIKTDIMIGSIINGIRLPPKLKFPCAAGIFAHGIEDEFYQVQIAACKSMDALAKFSTQYAQKALDMLMDMMNDDTDFAGTISYGNVWMFECAGAAHAYGRFVVITVPEVRTSVLKDEYWLKGKLSWLVSRCQCFNSRGSTQYTRFS